MRFDPQIDYNCYNVHNSTLINVVAHNQAFVTNSARWPLTGEFWTIKFIEILCSLRHKLFLIEKYFAYVIYRKIWNGKIQSSNCAAFGSFELSDIAENT